jgi:hypothetical protein
MTSRISVHMAVKEEGLVLQPVYSPLPQLAGGYVIDFGIHI